MRLSSARMRKGPRASGCAPGLRGRSGNRGFAGSPDLAPGGRKRHPASRSRPQWAIAAGAVSHHSGEVRRRRARDRLRTCAWPRGAERAHGRDLGPSRRQDFSAQLARLPRVARRRGRRGPRHGVQRADRRSHLRARGIGAAVRIAGRDRRAERVGERHLRLPGDSGRRPGFPFGRIGHAGPGDPAALLRSRRARRRHGGHLQSGAAANDGDVRPLRPLAGRDPRGADRRGRWRARMGSSRSRRRRRSDHPADAARRWNAWPASPGFSRAARARLAVLFGGDAGRICLRPCWCLARNSDCSSDWPASSPFRASMFSRKDSRWWAWPLSSPASCARR